MSQGGRGWNAADFPAYVQKERPPNDRWPLEKGSSAGATGDRKTGRRGTGKEAWRGYSVASSMGEGMMRTTPPPAPL